MSLPSDLIILVLIPQWLAVAVLDGSDNFNSTSLASSTVGVSPNIHHGNGACPATGRENLSCYWLCLIHSITHDGELGSVMTEIQEMIPCSTKGPVLVRSVLRTLTRVRYRASLPPRFS